MTKTSALLMCLWLILAFPLVNRSAGLSPMLHEWPFPRGNAALQGISSASLPTSPSLVWQFRSRNTIRSSPIVAQNTVFVGSDDGTLYALRLEDGRKLWTFKTEAPIEASPLFARGTVYVGSTDGRLYALRSASGTLKWSYSTGAKIVGAANILETDEGDWIVVGSHDKKLHCLASSGERLWEYETDNFINGTPATKDGRVIFGGCDALVHVVDALGKNIRTIEAGSYIPGSVAVAHDHAYLSHYENEFIAVNLKEGKVAWRYHDKRSAYFSSPAVTSNRVVFGGRDKYVHCLDRADGKPIWKFQTRGNVESSPVIAGDKVVFGSTDGRIYFVSLADGKQMWSHDVGPGISSSPAVARGMVIVGCEDGMICAFGEKGARQDAAARSDLSLK